MHAGNCQQEDKLAELFGEYKNLVFRTAYLVLGSREDAEDALQEVFVHVFRALDSYDARKASYSTWIHRITVNHCLNRLRSRPMFVPLGQAEQVGGDPGGVEGGAIERQLVRQALECLGDNARAVVVLRYLWDLSYAEIACILDVPLGTVKSRLSVALETVRQRIGLGVGPRCAERAKVRKEAAE
jgi:RNA polymerase sigma-70 factor, ECF subfamily